MKYLKFIFWKIFQFSIFWGVWGLLDIFSTLTRGMKKIYGNFLTITTLRCLIVALIYTYFTAYKNMKTYIWRGDGLSFRAYFQKKKNEKKASFCKNNSYFPIKNLFLKNLNFFGIFRSLKI